MTTISVLTRDPSVVVVADDTGHAIQMTSGTDLQEMSADQTRQRNSLSRRFAAMFSRYGALATQFVIVVLIARCLPQADAGVYLLMFGAVTTTTVFAGFGAPDGLVKHVPELVAHGRRGAVRAAVLRAAVMTALGGGVLLAGLVGLGLWRGIALPIVATGALWWAGYSIVFFCGQALVALGLEVLGAFVFYALNNLLLVVTTIPYLLFATHPDGLGALCTSVLASALASLVGLAFVARTLAKFPSDGRQPGAGDARLGLMIATARMFQAALYWVPAWVVAARRGPAEAAVMGTAGRLLIAATAVIAVFRFTLRARIVAAGARGDKVAIEAMARAAATISSICALVALVAVMAIGGPLVALVFGDSFRPAAMVLGVLLVGALGESIGGPVDEVLKYQGYAVPVLVGLIVTVVVETVLAWVLAPHGALAAAWAQAIAFCGMYAFQILLCHRRLGILILPYLEPARLKAALAH